MGKYNVRITKINNNTVFTLQGRKLASIQEFDGIYWLTVGEGKITYPDYPTKEDAIAMAKERITIYLNSLGATPNFIND